MKNHGQTRKAKIIGIGKYLPKKAVYSEEFDKKFNLAPGWTKEHTGVSIRYYTTNETPSKMGTIAAKEALKNAGISLSEIDCIICASAARDQTIPCTAALIQRELGGEVSGIPAFDIDSTCLSFLLAFDLISYLINADKFNKVIIISPEMPSIVLNHEDKNSCTLFGDGAAATIIEKTPNEERSQIICSSIKTFSKGAEYNQLRGGGSNVHPREYSEHNKKDFLFYMDGKNAYKLVAQLLPSLVYEMLEGVGMKMSDLDMVIPHQASLIAMELIRKKLDIPYEKYMRIIHNHGNTVAAAIPMALYEAVKQKRINRGDRVMLLGTSAGISLGAVVFEY